MILTEKELKINEFKTEEVFFNMEIISSELKIY
jgi:hypothetical protein